MTNREKFTDKTITWAGDTWLVGGVGAEHEGRVMCHLWSTTTTICKSKNGNVPRQMCDWLPIEVLEAA